MTWQTWNPFTNRRYEALSYLPPLTAESIAKEVDFILAKGWVPCLEFDKAGEIHRSNSRMPGYYDGRYWTLWKLPMFGCAGAEEVLRELDACRREYPDAYIRLIAFDGFAPVPVHVLRCPQARPCSGTGSGNGLRL
ncbi:unnamed protein product [Urochloa humidicola]